MTKYTPKWFYLLITILIYLQGCEKRPQNIDVTEGYESIVEKLEDAIQYEIESKDLNAISMVLVGMYLENFIHKNRRRNVGCIHHSSPQNSYKNGG